MNYRARRQSLQSQLRERKLDALLITHLANIRYLCGFTGSAGVLLAPRDGRPLFFTDGRYREQARSEVKEARVRIAKGAVLAAAAGAMAALKLKIVGIESEHMRVAERRQLAGMLPRGVRLRETAGVVEQQRLVKETAEVDAIRAAVHLASGLFQRALQFVRPGVKESAVAAELEYAARRAGAQGMSFETIVAAGPRSALPHGVASAHAIPGRGFVVLDFGVILGGYCSDMTRTVYVGEPDAADRGLYQAVREAQEAATQAVRPGRAVGEVDRAARSGLRRARLDRYFTHSTGHGVGLEIHEPPRLGKGQREILRPGMVVTIEPGVYIPGRGGVRIEDMVVVTATGCEVLTPTSKELLTL